jgi:hypothetical protein
MDRLQTRTRVSDLLKIWSQDHCTESRCALLATTLSSIDITASVFCSLLTPNLHSTITAILILTTPTRS